MLEFSGNLFNTNAPAIGHGVNIKGLMGAGIAVQFARLWPEMHRQYRGLCGKNILNPGEAFVYHTPTLTIYNIASQDLPGRHARLDWLSEGVDATLSHAKGAGYDRVALPRIGCGIGGLNWDDVKPVIEGWEVAHGVNVEVWSL